MSFTLFISSFTFCTLFVVYFLSFIFIPYFPNLSLILSFFTIYPLSLITFFIPYPLFFSAFIPYPLYFLAFIPYPLRPPDPSPKEQSIQLLLIFPMYLHYMSVSIDFQFHFFNITIMCITYLFHEHLNIICINRYLMILNK